MPVHSEHHHQVSDFYFIYGVKNLPGNRKIVVTAEFAAEYNDARTERDRQLSLLAGTSWVPNAAPSIVQNALNAGAHEVYIRAPLTTPGKTSAGVGEPLPAGALLVLWGKNGATYTTTRPNGLPGPAQDTWLG